MDSGKLERFTCSLCGSVWEAEDCNMFENEPVCDECLENRIQGCPGCSYLFDIEDSGCGEVHGAIVCPDCYNETFTCHICGESGYDSECYNVEEFPVCGGCRDNSSALFACENCGDVFFVSNAIEHNDELYCESCFRETCAPINNYHEGPPLKFFGLGKYHMGVELEVDDGSAWRRNESAEKVIDITDNHVYCSRDGSLETGFEIITHPHTYEEMCNLPWQRMFDSLTEDGWKGHDTTTAGLHIHIGRKCFDTESSLIRFCAFFENNWPFVKQFSRRSNGKLRDWANRYCHDDCDENKKYSVKDVKDGTDNDSSRYRAVNLCNDETVEVRIFRSTLCLDTFLAALELVYLLAERSNTITDEQAENYTPSEWLWGASENLKHYCETRDIPLHSVTDIIEEAA